MGAIPEKNYIYTQNACRLCAPIGAALVFKGIEGAIPLIHGSQGCSTYMERYLTRHFKEPVDIASSNFTEKTTVFGGGGNLEFAIEKLTKQYSPAVIGIANTCLSETVGEDVPMILKAMGTGAEKTALVHVPTHSSTGTHEDGFHQAVQAVTDHFNPGPATPVKVPGEISMVNVFPGMLSNEDLRHLKEVFREMSIKGVMLPDYSESLDGPPWTEDQVSQGGGTPVREIRGMNRSLGSIEFGHVLAHGGKSVQKGKGTAGTLLKDRFQLPLMGIGMPMGIRETDRFFAALATLTGKNTPQKYLGERGRLIDAYVNSNRYLSGKRAIVYGEEDFVTGMAVFLSETGIVPVLCASGGKSVFFEKALKRALPSAIGSRLGVRGGVDFVEIEQDARALCPDLIIGNSMGYATSRRLNIPLVRVGFPIHDRVGGARILHIGYRGAHDLLDTLVNTLLNRQQGGAETGYAY